MIDLEKEMQAILNEEIAKELFRGHATDVRETKTYLQRTERRVANVKLNKEVKDLENNDEN